jgi:hypothetical protein
MLPIGWQHAIKTLPFHADHLCAMSASENAQNTASGRLNPNYWQLSLSFDKFLNVYLIKNAHSTSPRALLSVIIATEGGEKFAKLL